MTYAIVKVINGTYSIHAEGITNVASAKVTFHGLCQTLWNAPDVLSAEVAIMDENLDAVEGYKEFISHEPTPQPETEPEPETESEPETPNEEE